MDIRHARITLRERSLLDVVDLALRFIVHHAVTYAKMSLIVLFPAFLVTWGAARALSWGWAFVFAVALASFAKTPFTVLASRLVFAPDVRVSEVLAASSRAFPRLILVRGIQGMGVIVGSMFFFVPGLWVAVSFFFASEVIVLEQASVGGGIGRMQRLSSGSFGDVALAFLFLLALQIVAIFGGDATGRAILEDLLEITPPPSLLETHGSAMALAALWAFVPIAATCRFLLYVNIRTRNEGWDIQTRFAALAARASTESTSREAAT